MEKALQRYVRWHRSAGSSPKTIRYHSQTINLFIRWCPQKGYSTVLADLDADLAREWIEDQHTRGLSAYSIATRVGSLRAWTRWMVAEEWLTKNPLQRLKVPKTPDKPKPVLTPSDVDRLLAVCGKKTFTGRRDHAILLLLLSTGLRASELLSLQVEDINWKDGLIIVRRGKGGKTHVVPLGSKVERALDHYLDGRETGALFVIDEGEPLNYGGLRSLLQRRGKKAGVKVHTDQLRHSAAIAYLRAGGRIENLRAMLGHSTIDLTLHYAHVAGVDLAAAHQTVDPTKSLKTR